MGGVVWVWQESADIRAALSVVRSPCQHLSGLVAINKVIESHATGNRIKTQTDKLSDNLICQHTKMALGLRARTRCHHVMERGNRDVLSRGLAPGLLSLAV
ncbi:hypothetical protein [Roseibium sp.]|uniref:hypothetical protein n=1 Tax=Roseibium sp. TaxID=1936156 RepID=UPI00391A2E2D